MGIKVLFLYPNTFGMNMIPQAMALFSSLLKKEGHQVEIFDSTYYATDFGLDSDGTQMDKLAVVPFSMEDKGIRIKDTSWSDDLLNHVEKYKPDLIGLSTTEDMYELGLLFLDVIKDYKLKNNIPVIAGGVFPTFAPEIVIKEKLIDLVCVGEGENSLIQLCKKSEEKQPYNDITNCWVKTIGPEYLKDRNVIQKNPISKPVDINTNPMIDISLFEENRLYRPMGGKVYKMFPVETIRGCPYTCKFCNSPTQMDLYKDKADGGYFRKKNMKLVSDELKHFKNDLGVEYNYFWADTFLAMNKKEFEEFCEMYSEIKIPFWFQTRPETINDYNMKKLAEVGLDRISFGVEHGNAKFRKDILDRRWSNEQIIDKLKIPHKYGINFSVNNITGFPHETRKLAFDTIELNRNIDSDNANIHTFVPFHGTPLRKMCEDLGYIKPETITKCIVSDPVMQMPQYPLHEIKEITKCFNLYVKFPKNRWKEIERSAQDDEEGRKLFNELSSEYLEKYMPAPNADPHGGLEDFIEAEKTNQQCIPVPISKVSKTPNEDEML